MEREEGGGGEEMGVKRRVGREGGRWVGVGGGWGERRGGREWGRRG